jgi:hypothetical protein
LILSNLWPFGFTLFHFFTSVYAIHDTTNLSVMNFLDCLS